jgi:hypothetical protein
MKNTLLAGLIFGCVAAFSVEAQAAKQGKAVPKEDQQAQRDAIIQKYDRNGDGVLDKAESKKLSKSDKKLLAKTGGVGTARKSTDKSAKGDEAVKPEAKPEAKPESKPEVVKPATRPQPASKPADAQATNEVKKAEKSARGKSAK